MFPEFELTQEAVLAVLLGWTTGVVTHPMIRLFTRVVTVVGGVAATVHLMKESKTARYIISILMLLICSVLLVGCAPSHVTFNDEIVETTEESPVSGVYCHETLTQYQEGLKQRLSCIDCSMPEFSQLAKAYDECVLKHKEDKIIVNPFNRIRGL